MSLPCAASGVTFPRSSAMADPDEMLLGVCKLLRSSAVSLLRSSSSIVRHAAPQTSPSDQYNVPSSFPSHPADLELQPVNAHPNQNRAQPKNSALPHPHRHPRAALEDLHLALAQLRHARGVAVDSEAGERCAACVEKYVNGLIVKR